MKECQFGERISGELEDSNENVFGPNINGLANPMRFDVSGDLPVSKNQQKNIATTMLCFCAVSCAPQSHHQRQRHRKLLDGKQRLRGLSERHCHCAP
jgi:hypothetical protein